MDRDHQPQVPIALEHMLAGLDELETVLGESGRRAIPTVRASLTEALAARGRGDPVATIEAVGAAMRALAEVGERLAPGEGQLMASLAQNFRGALMRGDLPEAKKDMDVMFDRSGARVLDEKK